MMAAHSDLILLVDALARLQGRLHGAFDRVRIPDLSDMERTVLAAVVEAQGPPTVPQIGRSLGHARQVVQRAADSLAAAGLIVFVENPDHKRASLLEPTKAGRRRQDQANARAEAVVASLMNNIDPGELRQAIALLTSIRKGIEAHERVMTP